MQKIKSQIDKFNNIRKVQSEYLQKRKEVIEKDKREKEEKRKEVRTLKDQIQNSIKVKRQELFYKNREIMEEVMRDTAQAKHRRKKQQLPKDQNK